MSLATERLREQQRPGREPEREVESPARVQLKRELASLPYAEQAKKIEPPLPPIVQTLGGAGTDSASVQQAAARGVEGPGTALPHAERIQRAFGQHSVGGIKAHVGGGAAQAATAMGAVAYATGSDVAFKASPDLHTAAHEAAHIVQQRQGVSLPGGVGQRGDAYERHADAVADRVVAGQSAEALLSSAPAGAGDSAAVQREEEEGGQPPTQGPDLGGLPTGGYLEYEGGQHSLQIRVENGVARVVLAESGQPLATATDSTSPITLARQIESLTAQYVTSNDPNLLPQLKTMMEQLSLAMAMARGEHIPMVALRTLFEDKLSETAWVGSYGNFARGPTAVNLMCQNAIKLLGTYFDRTITAATSMDQVFAALESNEAFKQKLQSTGKKLSSGFAGAVGLGYDQIKAVFTGGDMTQRCVHLANFGDVFLTPGVVAGMTSPTDENAIRMLEMVKQNVQSLGGDAYARFLANAARSTTVPAKAQAKTLLTQSQAHSPGFSEAKGNREMDRKLPYEPIENLTDRELTFLAEKCGVPTTGITTRDGLLAALRGAGFTVAGEIKDFGPENIKSGGSAASITEDGTVFLQGIVDNIVDPEHSWIMAATAMQMPLKAGISGTTHRFMSLAELLGVGGSDPRLAMVGHLPHIQAHSFHEIMAAAAGFGGCEYEPGKYIPFSPIPPQQMGKLAKDVLKEAPEVSQAVTGEGDLAKQAARLLGVSSIT